MVVISLVSIFIHQVQTYVRFVIEGHGRVSTEVRLEPCKGELLVNTFLKLDNVRVLFLGTVCLLNLDASGRGTKYWRNQESKSDEGERVHVEES